ncbi:MAG: MFS transporter [bacterium]|nr:MFS transporter [bacterium]
MAESNFRISVRLLCTRRFGTFWFASLLANIGTWAQQVAQPWLLLTLGASSFLVGLDAFALGAPVLLLTLVGGVLADRADRRRIIAVFQSIQMLCPVMLVVLLLAGILQPWEVIVISLVVGITDALSMPSFQTIVPSIVERRQLSAGLALNSMQFNLSRILGPSLAGVLMASVGAIACFAVSAASYAPFIFVALWILPHGRIARPAGEKAGARHPFAGIRAITRHPDLRGALLTVVVASLFCGPLITFIPVLVKDVFHGDVRHYSLAAAAFGGGGLLGAAALLFVDASQDLRRWNTWFARGFGVVLVAAALNPWLWAVPVLTMLAGATMTLSNTLANSHLQFSAPAHFRGQTISLFMLAMRGGLALGSLLTGLSASLVGVRYALLINGLLAVLAQAVIGWQWLRLVPQKTPT